MADTKEPASSSGVEIPDIPSQPLDLEECSAALFQASGHFVEQNVIEKDEGEVLQLDVVATSYEGTKPSQVLAEAKSGKWGYADVFKVFGWMNYLAIPQGVMLVTKASEQKDIASIRRKTSPLGVSIVHLDNEDLCASFAAGGLPLIKDLQLVNAWRFSYAVQRTLIRYLQLHSRSNPKLAGAKAALAYHGLVNDELFFEPNLRSRLLRLYAAFSEHPKLSLGVAREEETGVLDCSTEDPKNRRIWEAIYQGKHDAVQSSFYIEHRARLALLKTAIDLHYLGAPEPKPILTDKGKAVLTEDDFLPASFRRAFRDLTQESHFIRYALVWQVFLWVFGGFYLDDRKDTEFAWLSEQTGVPKDEIANALAAYDKLFPSPGASWLARAKNSHCVVAKMVPMALQGMGAYYRSLRYKTNSYAELGYTDMTAKDLSKWHNKGYEVLRMREGLFLRGIATDLRRNATLTTLR